MKKTHPTASSDSLLKLRISSFSGSVMSFQVLEGPHDLTCYSITRPRTIRPSRWKMKWAYRVLLRSDKLVCKAQYDPKGEIVSLKIYRTTYPVLRLYPN